MHWCCPLVITLPVHQIVERGFMKKNIRQILALLLITVIMCSSCRSVTITRVNNSTDSGMETESVSESESDSDSREALEEQEAFDEFTDDLFIEMLSESSLAAHMYISDLEAYGLTGLSYSLGDLSKDGFLDDLEYYNEILEELNDFTYDYLTADQQLTYDILKTDLEDTSCMKDFYGYDDNLSPLSGTPVNLPAYFSVFELNCRQDVIDCLELLKNVPDFYSKIIDYEVSRSEKGMSAPDFEIDHVIDSCNEFIGNKDNNFLITTFNSRIGDISDLSDDVKEKYIAENKDIILNQVIPAYQTLISDLSGLKGKNKTDGGLANYSNGKKYYELLVRSYTGSDKSVSEIEDMINDKYEEDINTIVSLGNIDPELYDNMTEYPMDTSDPDKILKYLIKNITDFPTGYETNYTVNYVPKDIEKYQSPAYYYIPHIDNITNNQIFINGSDEYKDQDLYTVLAHEGFPGHMYQTTYFHNTNPSSIRYLLKYDGYTEGWGLYSELYSYSISGQSKEQAEFNVAATCLNYDLYCLADIGINYNGWTREDTKDFITSLGFDASFSDEIFEFLVENPGIYLSYYVGYLEIMDLRTEAQETLGKKFSMKAFHKFIMDIGPAQFEIIRVHFNLWLEKQQNSL